MTENFCRKELLPRPPTIFGLCCWLAPLFEFDVFWAARAYHAQNFQDFFWSTSDLNILDLLQAPSRLCRVDISRCTFDVIFWDITPSSTTVICTPTSARVTLPADPQSKQKLAQSPARAETLNCNKESASLTTWWPKNLEFCTA